MKKKKRKKVHTVFLVVLLLIASAVYITKRMDREKAEQSERTTQEYIQRIKDRCNYDFPIEKISFGSGFFVGFQDFTYEFKCELSGKDGIEETVLTENGWHCSLFPEKIFRDRDTFAEEMCAMNREHSSYWLFMDVVRDAASHELRYNVISDPKEMKPTDHFIAALYIPEEGLLYYLEDTI